MTLKRNNLHTLKEKLAELSKTKSANENYV